MFKSSMIALSLLMLSPIAAAKPNCSPLQDDLKKVRSQLRSGYSAKQGEKLKIKEKKAKKLWWQCKTNKLSNMEQKKLNKRLKKQKSGKND
ncbi:hypothetical protein RGQ13_03380 [Thalassotalea psychrophila]|uniref:Orphan protein n=1 Tax=Thalassotalea psychrophila TaxID=3065647 RepID=A0ABY9TWB1_9GAMM|nr:hypothetical protein RGQ13_03380 [Colwelliaceae bacterium SQ149]